jgi:hypothetical protein
LAKPIIFDNQFCMKCIPIPKKREARRALAGRSGQGYRQVAVFHKGGARLRLAAAPANPRRMLAETTQPTPETLMNDKQLAARHAAAQVQPA